LVFPVGGLSTDQRIDALLSYPITVLGCTPSYALFLAEAAAKKGIDLSKDTKIRITWHTGEPGASIPATRAKIEAAFGAKAYDLPGLTEIAAWGFECESRAGLTHVNEDYCYPEVLDDILIRIDPSPSLALGERDGLQTKLAEDLRIGLGIRVTVDIGEPGSLPRWDHKARRVRDERTEVPF